MVVVDSLKKRFGRHEVLTGVSAEFRPGLVTAVVGPNASGKTTLLKSILGLVRPDSGSVTIDGQLVGSDPQVRARVGYMPQEPRFPDNLKVSEVFSLVQDLRGEKAVDLGELIDYFALREHLAKPLRTLSGGTKQKASAVLTFAFHPRVLILDEPSAGLDPVASSRLKDRILRERAQGATVLLTSHVMSELEELADEVLFLLEGVVRFRGTLDMIRESTGESRLERAVAKLMSGSASLVEQMVPASTEARHVAREASPPAPQPPAEEVVS
jgi:Cu-processing system ATP-binding protein